MRSKIYCCMGMACLSVRIPNRNSRYSYESNFKRELFAMVQTEYMEITKEKTNSQELVALSRSALDLKRRVMWRCHIKRSSDLQSRDLGSLWQPHSQGAKGVNTLTSLSPWFPASSQGSPVAKPQWKPESRKPVDTVN